LYDGVRRCGVRHWRSPRSIGRASPRILRAADAYWPIEMTLERLAMLYPDGPRALPPELA
jgi:hypothetical protein